MGLALLSRLLELDLDLAVLLAVGVVALLEFVDLPQQELVLVLEVRVFALEDALDGLVAPRVLAVALSPLQEGQGRGGLEDVSVGDAGVGLGGVH